MRIHSLAWVSSLFAVCAVGLALRSPAQAVEGPPKEAEVSPAERAKIVPIAVLRAGETTELLLSTWCTVGVTRGGGLGVGEMLDGKVQYTKDGVRVEKAHLGWGAGKSYSRDGLHVEVPDFTAATQEAALPAYAPLKAKGVSLFRVKVTADKDARPGVFEMHLFDATCNGHCSTDFRVLVVQP